MVGCSENINADTCDVDGQFTTLAYLPWGGGGGARSLRDSLTATFFYIFVQITSILTQDEEPLRGAPESLNMRDLLNCY